MAYPIQVTLTTGNKVSLNYQSQEVSVTLTYQLEREDSDVLALVQEKAKELAKAHQLAWQGLHKEKVSGVPISSILTVPNSEPSLHQELVKGGANSNAPVEVEATPQATVSIESTAHDSNSADLPPDEWLKPKAPLEPATLGQRDALRVMLQQARWTQEHVATHLQTQFECERIEDLTAGQAANWLLELQRAARLEAQRQRLEGSIHSRNGAKTGTSKA